MVGIPPAAGPPPLRASFRARAETFDLEVELEGTAGITALFGPSGAGKSLTLRYLAGLERPSRGRIELGGRILFDSDRGVDLPPRERGIGVVFQSYALFPHLNVASNIGYGLHDRPPSRRRERIRELLELMGLEGFEDRRPARLSGGERQRVALARALAPEPALLLLDEPFAAVDFRVRRGLRDALSEIHEGTGVPMVLVTHSLADVRRLSDTLVILDRGRVVAAGPTDRLVAEPPSPLAAELLQSEDAAGSI